MINNQFESEPDPEPEIWIEPNIEINIKNQSHTQWQLLWSFIKIWIEPKSLPEPHREPPTYPLIKSDIKYECNKIINTFALWRYHRDKIIWYNKHKDECIRYINTNNNSLRNCLFMRACIYKNNYEEFVTKIKPINLEYKCLKYKLKSYKKTIYEYSQKFNQLDHELDFMIELLGLERTSEDLLRLENLLQNV